MVLKSYWKNDRFKGVLIAAPGLLLALVGFLLYLIGFRHLGWLLVLVAYGIWLTGFLTQLGLIFRSAFLEKHRRQ